MQLLLRIGSAILATSLIIVSASAATKEEVFSVLVGGTKVGHLKADVDGDQVKIDFDFKNNGRGPTMKEEISLDSQGLPIRWTVKGNSTFGNAVDESFVRDAGVAKWTDSTGTASADTANAKLYVAQNGSPWSVGIYARALLESSDKSLAALPGGTLQLKEMERLKVTADGKEISVISYSMTGSELDPAYFLLDEENAFFATISPRFAVVRAGFEGEDKRLRALAVKYATDRFISIQKKTARKFDKPVRITNVRIFDPQSLSLTEAKSVVVSGNKIAAVIPNDSPASVGEVTIDGEGGTIVPGLFEMHGHLGQDGALLNIAAGVTSVRDMGNNYHVLDELIGKFEDGTLAGPRVTRSGFIEGKSPFSSNNGILVDSQEKAINAARFYAARGFNQIKIYNSMNPKWVPSLIAEAKKLGLRVAGHVPAFTNADAMIAAGYDEMTHINQVMLGWVLKEGEDTRSLLRLTALQRLPALDLDSAAVQRTIDAMVANGVAIDPTFAIHEALLLSRNGKTSPGTADYIDHMPVGEQRSAKQAWSKIDSPEIDAAYRGAFDQITKTIKIMHERGIFIIPGTDLGGSFAYHRELELYQNAGFSAAEILKRATYDMAKYLGQEQQLGSIEKGKLADFFLVPGNPTTDLKAIKKIRMVVKDGTVYFPSEIYSEFGIKPFVDAPKIVTAQ